MDNQVLLSIISAVSAMIVALIGIIPTVKKGNKETLDKIGEVEGKLDKHIEKDDNEHAKVCRSRIMKYASDVRNGVEFDQDVWNAIKIDCDFYKDFCVGHPDFPNGICQSTIKFLEEILDDLVAKGKIEGSV